MFRRKRKIITFSCAILVVIVAALAIVFINKYKIVYKEKSVNGNIEVVIQTSDIFRPATMGGQEYTLIVYQDSVLFRKKLLDKTFWFINDGAPLVEGNIDVEWFDNSVKITINSDEGNPKVFTCDF